MKKALLMLALFVSFNALSQGQLQKETSGFISFVSGKALQLAEAIPAEKYDWRPDEGVRSFAEVFAHIISSNYFFASKLGAEIPEGVNMETLEQELKDKEEIVAAIKQSFEVASQAVQNTEDEDLATKVEYPFPGEFTNMSSILILMSHSNEHLGQLIAYSRMNGITPPWSAREE